MAMRSVVSRTSLRDFMEATRSSAISGLRYFSDGNGRILSEEERAAEKQKWWEEFEKQKRKNAAAFGENFKHLVHIERLIPSEEDLAAQRADDAAVLQKIDRLMAEERAEREKEKKERARKCRQYAERLRKVSLAAENVYIQKLERGRLEKLKQKAAENDKAEKKSGEPHKG